MLGNDDTEITFVQKYEGGLIISTYVQKALKGKGRMRGYVQTGVLQ